MEKFRELRHAYAHTEFRSFTTSGPLRLVGTTEYVLSKRTIESDRLDYRYTDCFVLVINEKNKWDFLFKCPARRWGNERVF